MAEEKKMGRGVKHHVTEIADILGLCGAEVSRQDGPTWGWNEDNDGLDKIVSNSVR